LAETNNNFVVELMETSLGKLAKMLRILSFLTQIKVYLFWKNLRLK